MGVPTLELLPGVGLGPFSLGSPIGDALAQVEQQQSLFESTVIKYNEQDPLAWDAVVAFPHLGFHLCFDPAHQRLYKVEVYDITRVHLRYASTILGGPSSPATFARIYSVLGPTFPGSYAQQTGTYTLSYPGLSLLFCIPPAYASRCLHCKELPMEFPDGTTPVVSRIILHPGDLPLLPPSDSPHKASDSASTSASFAATEPPSSSSSLVSPSVVRHMPRLALPGGGVYMEQVQVHLGRSLFFTASHQELFFGFSPQDVWSEMGRPCSILQRQTGSPLKHLSRLRGTAPPHHHQHHHQQLPLPLGMHQGMCTSSPQHPQQQLQSPEHKQRDADFVWSYFNRGIDVVFDSQSMSVTKFVLHTNALGHPDFSEYAKCNFVFARLGAATEDGVGDGGGAPAEAVLTADSTWDDVTKVLGGCSHAAIQTAGSLQIAFGPTFVYGLRGAAFEVMRNGHISTVTLFETGDW